MDELCKLHLQIDKAKVDLNWSPKWSFEMAIEKTINWYRKVLENPTLAKELCISDINDYQLNRARYETEAEGVAYVVAEALGIHSETDAYSFGYIATWGKDDTKKLVKESLSRIQKCLSDPTSTFQENA